MVIEKFIPSIFKTFLQNLLENVNFEWHYMGNSLNYNAEQIQDGIFQFIHIIVDEQGNKSPHYEKIKPLLYFFELHTGLKIKGILRMKANLLTQRELSEDINKLAIHTDINEKNYVSFVYYVNDSDGDTVVYNADKTEIIEKASPIAGNCFWFKSNQFHNATPPKHHSTRIVINCILQIENE